MPFPRRTLLIIETKARENMTLVNYADARADHTFQAISKKTAQDTKGTPG